MSSHSLCLASFMHGRHFWGKAIIAKDNPYRLAVLDNVGGEAAGGSGCATPLCTVNPKASICSGCQYR